MSCLMQDNGSWVDSAWTGRCQSMGDWLRLNYGNEPGYLDRYLREPKPFICRQRNGSHYWPPIACP